MHRNFQMQNFHLFVLHNENGEKKKIENINLLLMIDFHTFVLLQSSLYDLYWKWFPFSLNVCDMCLKCFLSVSA